MCYVTDTKQTAESPESEMRMGFEGLRIRLHYAKIVPQLKLGSWVSKLSSVSSGTVELARCQQRWLSISET